MEYLLFWLDLAKTYPAIAGALVGFFLGVWFSIGLVAYIIRGR